MKKITLPSTEILASASVVTVGCFDGLHRGHQLLVGRVVSEARRRGLAATVVTFDRLPRQLFDPAFLPQLLSTPDEKAELLRQLGVDQLAVLPFTREVAQLSAADFMRQVLCGALHAEVLLTGYDNRFGHDRQEGFDDYVRHGRQLGLEVLRGDVQMLADGRAVSSTVVRRLLAVEGRVDMMPQCLGRWYRLAGTVVAGRHIGRELGFPTANVQPDCPDKLVPAAGVYAVWATTAGRRLPAMMNIGTRPTFHGTHQTLEVHILTGDVGDLYGQPLAVEFVQRLRAEQKFADRAQLSAQLRRDRAAALAALEADRH